MMCNVINDAFLCFSPEKLQPLWEHKRHVPSVRAAFLPQHRVSQSARCFTDDLTPLKFHRAALSHKDVYGTSGTVPLTSNKEGVIWHITWSLIRNYFMFSGRQVVCLSAWKKKVIWFSGQEEGFVALCCQVSLMHLIFLV